MFGMMGSRMGQQMSGNASGFGAFNNMNSAGMDNPSGSMAMTRGGGMDPMGSIEKINKETVHSQLNQNGGMSGVGFSNPVGGMLGSIFRAY